MPWPMVHFLIAYELYDMKPKRTFLLGSVAPDAVLVRKDDALSKQKSHLYTESSEPPKRDDLTHFYKSNMLKNTDEDFRYFLFGYISHIYSDIQWSYCKDSISDSDASLRRKLWEEENQMDFDLYHQVRWKNSLVSELMKCPVYEIQGLYYGDELEQWRRQLFNWLDTPYNEPKIVNQYITKNVVEEFVHRTAKELQQLFTELVQL